MKIIFYLAALVLISSSSMAVDRIIPILPPVGYTSLEPVGLSSDGTQVLGEATGAGTRRAVIWNSSTTTSSILSGLSDTTYHTATAISGNGSTVLGHSTNPTNPNDHRPWIYRNGTTTRLAVPATYEKAYGLSISADGTVVGGRVDVNLAANIFADRPSFWTIQSNSSSSLTVLSASTAYPQMQVLGSIQVVGGVGGRYLFGSYAVASYPAEYSYYRYDRQTSALMALNGVSNSTLKRASADASSIIFRGGQLRRWKSDQTIQTFEALPPPSSTSIDTKYHSYDFGGATADESLVFGAEDTSNVFSTVLKTRLVFWNSTRELNDFTNLISGSGVNITGWNFATKGAEISGVSADGTVIVGRAHYDGQLTAFHLKFDLSRVAVTTPTSDSITTTTATLGGTVTLASGAAITERGVVYSATSVNSNPLIGGTGVTKVIGTGTTGVLTVNVGGLASNTVYSFKAYATNSAGTTYTSAATFTTLSSNADLSGLVISSGTLVPLFTSATTSYTVSVSNPTASLTVTPTVANTSATVKVNNVAVTSGTASESISLNVGSNVITIVATATDGATKTYLVTVTRLAPPTVTSPTNASITAATANLGGNVTADNGAAITERGVVYSATSANSNPVIGGTGVTKVIGTGTTGIFTLAVGSLTNNTGYSFKAYATNSAGTSYTTTASFNTLSSNANLSGLILSSGTLSPVFVSATIGYTATVSNATTSLTVRPTVANAFATVKVNNVAVSSGSASGAIGLNVGSSVITTVVTAQDGTTRTYTVTVTRAAAPPTLTTPTSAAIAATAATLGGNVTADGGTAITERGVIYSATATNSNPAIGGTGVTKVTGTGTTGVFTVNLSGLTNGTGYSFKAYAINSAGTSYTPVGTFTTLTTLNSNNLLSSLVLSSGTLAPTFTGANTSYTASVPNGTTSVTVTPTVANSASTVKVNNVTVASGAASVAVSLNIGSNTIATVVTAQDGATRTYTVTVTRLGPPTVTTPTSARIATTSATLGGNVTSDNGATIVERGVVYSVSSTNSNPSVGGTGVTQLTVTGTTGVFTLNVSGLSAAKNYTFKAYATNSVGTSYSSVATFLTPTPGPPAFTQPATVTTVAGSAFEFQLQATNGPNTFTCSNLPPWLSLNAATGWLSGTPPAAGDFNLSLTANNGFNTGSSSLAITVTSPTITSSLSDEGRQNEDYHYTITAGGSPTSFSTGVLPSGLTFNTTTGVISGRPTVSGTFNIALGATNSGGTANATLVLRLLPAVPPPVITSPSFASGTANAAFSFQLAASNTPQSYAIQSGPAWLSVNPATGLLSGTPTVPGTATVQVRASNATGAGAWAMLSISISPNPSAPFITSLVEARGRRNDPFSFQVTSSPPATSHVLDGTLPTGIVFGSSTGLFSGTPTVEGTFNLTLTASNSSGQSVPTPLRIVLGPSRQVPVVTSSTSFVATTGVAFSTTILASNSPSSFTFTGLPPGLAQVGTTAQISGTPTTPGSFNFTVRATNADGSGPIQNGVVTVQYHANAPRITASTVPSGYVGVSFSHQLLTDKPATSFAVIGGTSLPAGLTLGASSGLIGGTPTASGSFPATLQASNASGVGEPRNIVITISAKPDTPEVIGSLLEETFALASYSYAVQTKSLLPILSYSITGLPDGLSANPTTGRISGAATVSGVFEVKLKASNSVGVGAERVMRLTVRAGSLVPKITSSASASVVQGTPFLYQMAATNAPILGWEAAPLPDGLSLNPATGIISGKPVVAGTYQVILRASNVNGASDPLTLQIQVKPQVTVPVMVSQSYFSIVKSQPINVELQATNLPATRPWPSGTGIFVDGLPEGMSLNAATGVLSGEPASTEGFTSESYSYRYYTSGSFWRSGYYTTRFVYSAWYYKQVTLYANNDAGRGPASVVKIRFKPSDTTVPPVISGPKQLSWTAGQPLDFKITTNVAATRYEFRVTDEYAFSQTGSEFSLSGSSVPLPGRNTYRLGAYNGSWGHLDGLPLTVAPAAGAPWITNSNSMTATAGVPVSATLAASGTPTRYEITAMSPAWPAGLSFNATTGAFSGTVSQSGAISFLARAYNAVGASLPKEITLFVSPPAGAPVIATGTGIASRSALGVQSAPPVPLSGKVGEAFSHKFEASGNVIRFMVTGLPEGLVYNENTGEVAGEPTKPGLFELVVIPMGEAVSGQAATISLRIDPADGTPEMTSPSSATAVSGTAFTWQFTASENPAGYDLVELPDWLVFDALTGSISGTPVEPGETSLKISAFNTLGEGNGQNFTIKIAAAAGTPVLNPPTGNFTGQVSLAFNAAISGAGDGSFYDATALPFGISLDSETGMFSGVPVEPGTHEVRVWGVNAQGPGEQVAVTFVIAPAAGTPLLVGEPVLRLMEGQPLAHAFSTVPSATEMAVEGLPTGWSFDPVHGLLQGTPLSGIYPITLEAWNAFGSSGKQEFQVRVFANPGDLWTDEKFGDLASDSAISGWDADPDGDGVVNLLERAFNLSPVQAVASPLSADVGTAGLPLIRTTQGPGGPVLTIQYIRRKASTNPGLTYTPQISSSLGGIDAWSAATGNETAESIDAQWERVTVQESFVAGTSPAAFARVRVSLP